MVSYRELREIQRQQDVSHMGPGTHDTLKPFGSGLNDVNFGNKYKFDAGKNPGPGQYDPTKANKLVKQSIYEPFIKDSRNDPKIDPTPDAGNYEPHSKFGTSP